MNEFHQMKEPYCKYCIPVSGMSFFIDSKTLGIGLGVLPNNIYKELYKSDNPLLKEMNGQSFNSELPESD